MPEAAPNDAPPEPEPVAARQQRWQRLLDEPLDLLVVGGGITGAGIVRDAALRGLRVALIERDDYAAGTSSRSSKLVHGGLRYLEHFEFGLVFEATRERAIQRRLNPHLVWPLPFVFPVYRGARNGLLKIDVGLWLYDLLSLFRSYKLHRRLGPDKTVRTVPPLRREGLRGSVRYYDCRTNDARLTLANVLDAERHGALALSQTSFEEPIYEEGHVVGARVRDRIDGREGTVRCRHLAYAAGPWTDTLPGAPGDGKLLRPTKGIHIAMPRSRLPVDDAVVMTAVADGRVVFAVPDGDTTYVGTTDTDYDGDYERVRASSDDVSYLLETANHHFPDAELTAADVRSSWAGLRPLIRSDADSPYQTSREHRRYDDERGITTIAGGKLTTYRPMAGEVVDAAVRALEGRRGLRRRPCRTHRIPLDPELPRVRDPVSGPEDPFEAHLWREHGSGMSWVRQRMETHPAEREQLVEHLPCVLAQVSRAVLVEHALTVEDVLARRLPVFHRAADQGLACARRVAEHMASLLGRDADWVEAQVSAYGEEVERSQLAARALAAAP